MPFETVTGDSVSWGIRKPGGPVGYQSVLPYTSKNILDASIAEPLCFFLLLANRGQEVNLFLAE